MKLDEFHILQAKACTSDHAAAVTCACVRRCGREISAPVATCGQNDHFGVEDMHRTVIKLPANDTLALPVFGHDQIDREIFDIEFGVVLQRLAVKRVQDRVACAVRGGASALHSWAFAKLCCVAAEGTLINLALFCARKRNAIVLKLIDRLGRFASEIFHRICVTKPVRAFDRVIHMPLPVIRAHVGQRSSNTALRRNRVGARWENLGHTSGAQALLGHTESCTQTSATRTDNNNVIIVCFVFVFSHGQNVLTARVWPARRAQ